MNLLHLQELEIQLTPGMISNQTHVNFQIDRAMNEDEDCGNSE